MSKHVAALEELSFAIAIAEKQAREAAHPAQGETYPGEIARLTAKAAALRASMQVLEGAPS